jgi:hypothetical protein
MAALDPRRDRGSTETDGAVSRLPNSGPIYVRYWTRGAGGWQLTAQQYTMSVP